RPVAVRITRFSTGNLQIMKGVKSDATLYEDSEAGRATRERVGAALSEGLKREWFSTNMNLGYRYVGSGINVYAEAEDPEQIRAEDEEPSVYRQSTRPGCRAPHVWLDDNVSTLDWYGKGYVLVVAD